MTWFDRLFPAFMLTFPALFTLCVRPQAGADLAAARAKLPALWIATGLLVVLHGALQAGFEQGHIGVGLHRALVVGLPLIGFFPLWFGLAGPILAARHPGWRGAPAAGATLRAASLVPRDQGGALPRGAWVLGWVLYAAGVAVTVWSIVAGGKSLILLGLSFWPLFAWSARYSRLEAEPRDLHGSAELAEAWAAFRRFRELGFLACGAAGSAVFAVTGVLIERAPEHAALVGGLGGGAVGLVGAIFGTAASLRRAKVAALLARLSSSGREG